MFYKTHKYVQGRIYTFTYKNQEILIIKVISIYIHLFICCELIMPQAVVYSLLSVLIISLVSLIGVVTLWISTEKLKRILIYFIAFSAWTMMWDAFLHLLSETVESYWYSTQIALFIVGGILLWFIVEKVINRNHCHLPITHEHQHPFAQMNLVGDVVHNFIDWLVITSAFLLSMPVWIATALAVLLHEIPQEIWDFGVLIHWGFSKTKALKMNFLTALTAFIWVGLAILLQQYIENLSAFLMPFSAGLFIYISGTDLIPELHKHPKVTQSLLQALCFLLWIWVMILLLWIE